MKRTDVAPRSGRGRMAKAFSDCIGPSSGLTLDGPGDNHYVYPVGQRTFDFAGGDDAESKPITVVSKDNVEMSVAGVATFALNTDCKTLQQFHERIGLKYSAFFVDREDQGWRRMLNVYFKQPLDRAMDAASQEYEWKKLFNDPVAKQQWESRIEAMAAEQQNLAQQQINAKVKTELESIKELVAVLGPQGAVLWKAVQDGRVQIVPVPQGGNVVVAPK